MVRFLAASVVLVLLSACDKPGVPAEAKQLAAVTGPNASEQAAIILMKEAIKRRE